MSWGNLTLTVDSAKRATFTDWNRKASYKTESKENGTNWPKTANKGPELGTISFNTILARGNGIDVRGTLDKWIAACNAGTAYALKVGGIQVGSNMWQLRDVTEKETFYDNKAQPIQATMAITFQEYVSAGSSSSGSKTTSSKKTTKKKTSPSKTPSKLNDDKPKTDGVDPTQKYDEIQNDQRRLQLKRSGYTL